MATDNHTPERTYCIYRIVCFPTGRVYIGLTHNPKHRRNEHFSKLKKGLHPNPRLQRAYDKHGKEAFFFEVLERGLSAEQVGEREQHWIETFDCRKKGFNCKNGGESGGRPGTSCAWNGILYETLTAAAEANEMTLQGLRYRLDQGYTCDSDIPALSTHLKKPCSWNAVHYQSIKDAAIALNNPFKTMSEWIAKGWSCDQDVVIRGNPQSCIWNRITYSSLTAAAKANNIARVSMQRRLKRGYTCDDDMQKQ